MGTFQLLRILKKGGLDGTAQLKRHKRRNEFKTKRHHAPKGTLCLFSILTQVVKSIGVLSCSMSHRIKGFPPQRLTPIFYCPHLHIIFVPPTLSSWLLLTICSRSSFIKSLWLSTAVLFCAMLFISCCCATTFCGRWREKAWKKERNRATGYIMHLSLGKLDFLQRLN